MVMSESRRVLTIQAPDTSASVNGGYSMYEVLSYVNRLMELNGIEMLHDRSFMTCTRLLQVPCYHSTCQREPLEWCVKPNNKTYEFLHMTRWRLSFEEGWWGNVELIVPTVEELFA